MRLPLPEHYDFAATVGALPFSRYDPCLRVVDGVFWWATRTPEGPGTLRLTGPAAATPGGATAAHAAMRAEAWGPGADWMLGRASAVAGLDDDVTGFAELAGQHPVVRELAHRHRGHRLPATGDLFPRLLRTILEQKVTGTEAYRAYSAVVRHFREPAPGPLADLLLPPSAEMIAATPYWVFHPFGVEQKRADTLRRAAAQLPRIERDDDPAKRLLSINGIGPWTVAETLRVTHGDPDAVSVGDYHIPNLVSWALAGQARAGSRESAPGQRSAADERMLELLEPFRGHRGRVVELLKLGVGGAPRFGPRMPIRSFASY